MKVTVPGSVPRTKHAATTTMEGHDVVSTQVQVTSHNPEDSSAKVLKNEVLHFDLF